MSILKGMVSPAAISGVTGEDQRMRREECSEAGRESVVDLCLVGEIQYLRRRWSFEISPNCES